MEASIQRNDDKGLEKLMDEYLKANGLFRRKIAKDGSCLFRAVAEQVLHCQGLHTSVRAECVKYLRQERNLYESFIEGDFEEYLQRLQDPQSWVGQVEITALSVLYKHDFIIYQKPEEPPVNITENGYPDKVLLCFLNGNHYDSVYPLSYTTNAAICQSILYELLYEQVFCVDRSVLSANMRSSKVRYETTEENRTSDESDLDNGDDFWSSEVTGRTGGTNRRAPYKGRGRGQTRGGGRGYLLPKVQDSLNPTYFRNVEYDVWLRSKKAQQRRDFCMAAGMHYTAGDKCQVRLRNDGPYYSAYIENVSPDNGPVTVFIEELGEKHTVPLWNLRTPSEESWCTVTDKGKRHSVSNGNTPTNERETRGGRKPVRSVLIPHASPATAGSAPGNRVQKQHSWPPQAPAEARPPGRSATGRKADQGVLLPHVEEEHAVLEFLQKDENNFPTLEASAQAACSEGGRRAERKGPRKKAEAEMKEPSQRPSQKTDRGNHGKSSVEQELKICPSPLSTPPSAASPAPSAPKAPKPAPAIPANAPASAQSAPASAQSAPASAQSAPARSRTTPVPSTSATTSIQATPMQPQTSPLVAKMTSPARFQVATATPVTSAPTTISPKTSTQAPAGPRINPISTPSSSLTPSLSQTATAPPVRSTAPETTTVPNPSPPLFTPVTSTRTPVSTAAMCVPSSLTTPGHCLDTTSSSPPAPLPAFASSYTAPGGTSVSAHVIPQGPDPNPVYSQTAPGPSPSTTPVVVPSTATSHVPAHSPAHTPVHTPALPSPSSTPPTTVSVAAQAPPTHSAPPTVPTPIYASHSATPPTQPNIPSAPAAQHPPSIAPFHPVGLGAFPNMQPQFPPYPPPVPHPAPGGMPTPPPVMSTAQTLPFSQPPEPRPYDPIAPQVTGVGPAALPEYQGHAPAPPLQHTIPLPHLLSHDPLYPGFPQNDKDDTVQTPPFSFHHTGKDLPKDMNVLRWFFNLGVKAYTNQMWPPFTYLTPLTQAYHMQLKAPPSTSSLYTPTWLPDQNPPSLPHMSPTPSHTPMGPPVRSGGGPIGHFEVRAVTPGPPPVEVGGYGGHPHSMPMPPQPAVHWSAAHPPHVFPGMYPVALPGSVPYPVPPPGGEAYPPTSVGPQRLPIPPPLNRRVDITAATVPSAMERGEGDGQRSMTPQTEKPIWAGTSQLHLGGVDTKPPPVSIALATMEPQHGPGASPVVQAVLIGGLTGEGVEPNKLANGNTKDDGTKIFQGGGSGEAVSTNTPCSAGEDWEAEEAEYGDPDLRSGQLYYSQSFKTGGRRGQEDRGGFRVGSFRGRRDFGGRSRHHNQSVYNRVYRGRGRGRGYNQHYNGREAGYTGGQFAET